MTNTSKSETPNNTITPIPDRETLNKLVQKVVKDDFNQDDIIKYGTISEWNVSLITDMSNLFKGITNFNQPINDWDVGNITDMSNMFSHATIFNQPINN